MKLESLLLVVASALCTVAANLLMRSGIARAGGLAPSLDGVGTIRLQVLALGQQPRFLAGVVLYGLAALIWFRVVSTEKLSVSYPLLVSLTFTLVTLGAMVFFQERLSTQKVLGMALILGGVWLVAGA